MNPYVSNRGRWIIAVAAVMLLVACLLPWWQIGGEVGELSRRSDVGISDGRGFLIFLAAITTLLLISLPYAADHPIAIDHPIMYVSLLLIMFAAFVWRTVGLLVEQSANLFPFPPQHGLGYWLAALGLAVYARGVFEMSEAHRRV